MIPLPPSDAALGGMHVALDGAAVAAILTGHLEGRGQTVSVRACEPYYVKYKPDKHCVVQYRLELFDESDARRTRTVAHAALYPPKRAEKLRGRYLGRREDAGRSSPGAGAVYVEEMHALVQLYPVDFGLPGLIEAASPEVMTLILQRALPQLAGAESNGCDVELIRYKATKRAVLKYGLGDGSGAGIYGKLRRDGGRALPRVTRSFREAGVSTPPTLAYLDRLGMLVQAEGAGTRLRVLRRTSGYAAWMRPVARALARLHKSDVDGLHSYSPADEALELRAAAQVVGRLLPHIAADVEHLVGRLEKALASIDGKLCATHGSFHDDQVLVGDEGVVILDLDSAILGDPQSDVAHFLSYLSADNEDSARSLFLEGYREVHPLTNDLLIYEAASLLRWATLPFRELRRDWPQAIERRVRCAAERLDEHERGDGI